MSEFPKMIKFWTFSFQKSSWRSIENRRRPKAIGNYEQKSKRQTQIYITNNMLFNFVLFLQATVVFHVNYRQHDHISQFAHRFTLCLWYWNIYLTHFYSRCSNLDNKLCGHWSNGVIGKDLRHRHHTCPLCGSTAGIVHRMS